MSHTLRTRLVRAGREDLAELGVHAPPLDLSSTYPVPHLEAATRDLEALANGARDPHDSPVYARLHAPTVARFERAFATLEGADDAVAFGSGMAAITALLLAMASSSARRHVVAVRPMYGGTDHLLSCGLLGLEVTWAEPHEVGAAIRDDTALVLLETPGNPTCRLIDIASVVGRAAPVPVAVDSTLATPVLQRPLALGAAFAVHSATKFIGGHGDVVGGVIATSAANAAELRKVRVMTGGLLHPLAAYLLLRGLPTLGLRVEAAQHSAQRLARRLARHPLVTRVGYPGLPGGDPDGLLGRQMAGPGSLIAFDVAGGHATAARVMQFVRLATPAVSLGTTDTLIQHPAGLTHHVVPEAARESCGITPSTLRLSVGLEAAEDIWADLDQALQRAASAPDPAAPVSLAERAVGAVPQELVAVGSLPQELVAAGA